jgi:hypothetical protein
VLEPLLLQTGTCSSSGLRLQVLLVQVAAGLVVCIATGPLAHEPDKFSVASRANHRLASTMRQAGLLAERPSTR